MKRFFHLFACFILSLAIHDADAQNVAYSKIESSFNIPNISTDPAVLFDYERTDVKVTILGPDSNSITLPAFYDGGTTWRVRHTPALPGNYQIKNVALNGVPVSVGNLSPSNWLITGFPSKPGYIRVDTNNPRRFITGNGRRYFPVGANVAWDNGAHTVTSIFGKMSTAHLNWSRVWMDHWDGKNLDWNSNGSSPGPLGVLSLTAARKWDSIVDTADVKGIYFQMTLQHHGQYSTTTDSNWAANPYNTANSASTIGFLTSPVQFFTDATAKAVTKLKLRYAIARWGYSTAIMAWELFNEVQWTDAASSGQWSVIQSWHNEMAQFMTSQDPYHHLITTSSVLSEPIWDKTDYYQHHEYPTDLITGLRDAPDISATQPIAPNFSGECGTADVMHVGISPPVWAGLMSAQSGGAMPWWWDSQLDQYNDYYLLGAAADFVTLSGLGDHDALKKSSPRTSGGSLGSLVFAPEAGFEKNKGPDTFTIGSTAPAGISSATAFLQGNGNRSLLTNGYTFLVNYPTNGTFSVLITQIAACGGILRITVDGVIKTNVSFPAIGSCGSTYAPYNTNKTYQINVPSGQHTVKLSNPGPDWLMLGDITLDPYTPPLAAYAVGDESFQAIWLWHRSNIFSATPGPSVAAAVDVAGLNPGTYSGVWWDTFGAGMISNFTFTVTDSNVPVTLITPPVLRSVAFYAGIPAKAGIIFSNLTQTAASNSPPFDLPLVVTNSGGLPLAYSLSVTGAIPAWLSFSSTNGYVSKSSSVTVFLRFNPTNLAAGTYNDTLSVNTSDPRQSLVSLPVSLTVSAGTRAAPRLRFLSASSHEFVFQLQGDSNIPYAIQSSPDLVKWTSISTNTLPAGVLNITNSIAPGSNGEFWRALWQP